MTREEGGPATWHEWALELDLLVEGRKVRHRIDDEGRPFVTVNPGGLQRGWVTHSGFNWGDLPPDC
jgi:hypothetical protein